MPENKSSGNTHSTAEWCRQATPIKRASTVFRSVITLGGCKLPVTICSNMPIGLYFALLVAAIAAARAAARREALCLRLLHQWTSCVQKNDERFVHHNGGHKMHRCTQGLMGPGIQRLP